MFPLLLLVAERVLLYITTIAGKRSENQSEGAIWHE